MLIILEGADGVGKSTIAKRLARILNARIIHCTKDTRTTLRIFAAFCMLLKSNTSSQTDFAMGNSYISLKKSAN